VPEESLDTCGLVTAARTFTTFGKLLGDAELPLNRLFIGDATAAMEGCDTRAGETGTVPAAAATFCDKIL